MDQTPKKIIAIGGGGFTHRSDEVLDKFVIDQCKKKQINFGFLPTASEDNKDKIIDLIYNNIDEHNILIVCYDGNNISPYIVSLFLLKYGGSNITKDNIKNIIKSKHDDITMDFDLSVYGI